MASMALLLHKATWVNKAKTLAFWLLAVLAVASIGSLLAAKPAHADTIRVNSMEDAGDNNPGNGTCATVPFPVGTEPNCTLRAAIQETNANGESDTIVFDSFLSGTITLTLGQLFVANDIVAHDLIIQGPGARKITVSGNDASGVFWIHSGLGATISGLTISDGNAKRISPADLGGGGGIVNFGTLELINTTVSGNTAAVDGGGIVNFGTLELTNPTVSGNTAANNGGGIYNDDDGVGTVEVELLNTTVSGNTAAVDGGGIYSGFYRFNNDATVMLTNTIIARNSAPTTPDARGTFTSQGNNLIGNTTGTSGSGFGSSDLLNVNPLLGPLQDNGGSTDTHVLLPGSPAVDAANNTACPITDQRGVARKDGDQNGSVICDIGAFERNDLTPPRVTATTPTSGQTGVKRNTNLTATFSERMDRTTLTKSTFKLYKVKADGSTTQITAVSVSSTTDGLKATLNPFGTSTTVLAANTRYRAVFTTGAKDRAGNRLDQNSTATGSQPKVWTFTTGST